MSKGYKKTKQQKKAGTVRVVQAVIAIIIVFTVLKPGKI
jgi:hypothetical protein